MEMAAIARASRRVAGLKIVSLWPAGRAGTAREARARAEKPSLSCHVPCNRVSLTDA